MKRPGRPRRPMRSPIAVEAESARRAAFGTKLPQTRSGLIISMRLLNMGVSILMAAVHHQITEFAGLHQRDGTMSLHLVLRVTHLLF